MAVETPPQEATKLTSVYLIGVGLFFIGGAFTTLEHAKDTVTNLWKVMGVENVVMAPMHGIYVIRGTLNGNPVAWQITKVVLSDEPIDLTEYITKFDHGG